MTPTHPSGPLLAREPDDDGTLSALLRRAAARFPDRPAVIDGDRKITYRALLRSCRRLADMLHTAGIGRGDRIGIHLPRGLEACIAIYATLELGAAVVPLDAASPSERNHRIAADGALSALITNSPGIAGLVEPGPLQSIRCTILVENPRSPPSEPRGLGRVLSWDKALGDPAAEGEPSDSGSTERGPGIAPADLAYILYTSGSTGAPKGVMISHGAARAFVDWTLDTFGLTSEDRVQGVASYHFDLSIFDLFATCGAGACLFPLPADAWLHLEQITRRLNEDRISTWYSTPSALMLLLAEGNLERHRPVDLRRVLFAGEVFPHDHLQTLRRVLPHQAQLFNLYGPTETNVCTWHPVPALDTELPAELPIGLPCAGTTARVAGHTGSEVAPGEIGELWITGPSLTQGYWRDPRRTANSLVPDESSAGGRWYRTGDLVHRGECGLLFFRGRRDHMIKLRGFRIEIGEIEAALYEHPQIAETVVARTGDHRAEHRLTAWIVTRDRKPLPTLALRVFLGKKIPPYMIPAEYFFLESLPRTSTGKIDRRTLETSVTAARG